MEEDVEKKIVEVETWTEVEVPEMNDTEIITEGNRRPADGMKHHQRGTEEIEGIVSYQEEVQRVRLDDPLCLEDGTGARPDGIE